MAANTCTHDCDFELGILEDDLGCLTGFTSRAFAALAYLREAWVSADRNNKHAIERALIELMDGHSFRDYPELVAQVLSARLNRQDADELCAVAGQQTLKALRALRAGGLR